MLQECSWRDLACMHSPTHTRARAHTHTHARARACEHPYLVNDALIAKCGAGIGVELVGAHIHTLHNIAG